VIDIPKDVQVASAAITTPPRPSVNPLRAAATKGATGDIASARRTDRQGQGADFYTGGGVINSGPRASQLLRELAGTDRRAVTSTLMGLGAFPADHPTGSACWACTAPMKPTWR
jgi:acetolactate synthase-1/2/3 large subunit